MRVCFIHNENQREHLLSGAFLNGVRMAGDSVFTSQKESKLPKEEADVYCMVGVKSHKLFSQAMNAGKHVVFLDKGYFRHRGAGRGWEYWRVAVDDHHPTGYVGKAKHTSRRWDIIAGRRDVSIPEWNDRGSGGHIIYAGSSAKYHTFAGLPYPTRYAEDVVKKLSKLSNRMIVYRPKPSWQAAEPVAGTSYSPREDSIHKLLRGAWCLVTAGSNAAFDAILAGVPAIILGNAIARPISSTSLDDIENPRLATKEEVEQWLYNIAWCMFTEQEMRDGLAWRVIRPQFSGEIINETTIKNVAGDSIHSRSAKMRAKRKLKRLNKKKTKTKTKAK